MVLYYNNHTWAFQPSSPRCLLRYLMDVASAPFSARLQMPHLRNSRLKSLAGSMAKGSSSTMGPLARFKTKQLDASQTSTTGTADNQETDDAGRQHRILPAPQGTPSFSLSFNIPCTVAHRGHHRFVNYRYEACSSCKQGCYRTK